MVNGLRRLLVGLLGCAQTQCLVDIGKPRLRSRVSRSIRCLVPTRQQQQGRVVILVFVHHHVGVEPTGSDPQRGNHVSSAVQQRNLHH